MPAEVLAYDTLLEVAILDGQLEVREAKLPQKVSTLLKKVNGTILQPTVVFKPLCIELPLLGKHSYPVSLGVQYLLAHNQPFQYSHPLWLGMAMLYLRHPVHRSCHVV